MTDTKAKRLMRGHGINLDWLALYALYLGSALTAAACGIGIAVRIAGWPGLAGVAALILVPLWRDMWPQLRSWWRITVAILAVVLAVEGVVLEPWALGVGLAAAFVHFVCRFAFIGEAVRQSRASAVRPGVERLENEKRDLK